MLTTLEIDITINSVFRVAGFDQSSGIGGVALIN